MAGVSLTIAGSLQVKNTRVLQVVVLHDVPLVAIDRVGRHPHLVGIVQLDAGCRIDAEPRRNGLDHQRIAWLTIR